MSGDELETRLRSEAFRLLLAGAKPVSEQQLASAIGVGVGQARVALRALADAGRIRRDDSGRVIGSAGLSVVPDRHAIELDRRRFWTWCAYDILGIFGALKANGRAHSPSPSGRVIELDFERGRPLNSSAVLFRPTDDLMSCCENVYEQWCPNSNLFGDDVEARSWARKHRVEGRVMSLAEASDVGTTDWAGLAPDQ